jgi:hypothetical protein
VRKLTLLSALALFAGSIGASLHAAPAELAVAIRYLKAEGVSHSHIYLYREDGTLLRQLTKDDSGQDRDPFFAPDGKSIVFTRELKSGEEVWSIDPLGKSPRKLAAAPDWYSKAPDSPFFRYPDDPPTADRGDEKAAKVPEQFATPDGNDELWLKPSGSEDRGPVYVFRDVKTGKEAVAGKDTEFESLGKELWVSRPLQLGRDPNAHFLVEPPLRLAFCSIHLGSTDGDTVFALDLAGKRVVRLSPNWAAPIPIPGDASFLTFTSVRYVPIPGSTKTANCSYLERRDSLLNVTSFAKRDSAAILYGASMYRPGKKPATIIIRKTPVAENTAADSKN